MSVISRETAGGRAYIDLQRRATDSSRNTQELLQLYILEGFLAWLSNSPASTKLVLKGGVLLATFGNRRPTRDVDLAGREIGNAQAPVLALIKSVLDVRLPEDDGIEFDAGAPRSEVIRDVSLRDPIVPSPTLVSVPRLLGGDPIILNGYPLHMVHAEKIVTAIQLDFRSFRGLRDRSRWSPVTAGVRVSGEVVGVSA